LPTPRALRDHGQQVLSANPVESSRHPLPGHDGQPANGA
jgi:hypothetical protein